jgi:molybdate-binding protein/DNA-binding XRE family transcriptional regulator
MPEPKLISDLKRWRSRARLSQSALAERVGTSRQAIIAIEAGRQVPSTTLSLRLASALGCAVEDLFRLGGADVSTADVAPAAEVDEATEVNARTPRVALARVGGRWVAHCLPDAAPTAADGVLIDEAGGSVKTRPLVDRAQLEGNVLVVGCAPLLGALAPRVAMRHRDARATWLSANSTRALDLLEAGWVHVAGIHLAADAGRDNGAVVRERFPDERVLVMNLIRWRQGLVVAPGNPLGLARPRDLLREGLRFVRREEGAGATKLLRRLLVEDEAGSSLPDGFLAADHADVARLVRCGAADVGVAIESVALSAGLDFIPIAEERFDLVVPGELADEPGVRRFLEAVDDVAFRMEAKRLPGYDTSLTGHATVLEAA